MYELIKSNGSNRQNENKIDLKNVLFVGNDINDYNAMKTAGHKYCPSDSHESIKSIADYVLSSSGGDGVVREIFDKLKKNRRI